jgi:hypothetical protein
MKQHYDVSYRVTLTALDNGEFSNEQVGKTLSHISMSDDIGEVFTDLVDLHRNEYLVGLEILSIGVVE